ncbi:DJ-1/PfpI family protein [Pelagibacterium xiamenense]|uniref:DJ-1/PfpI family protein n=1 Tax=Pelagibacterium xiamenense TaxID=2901140 RepID=UPI001E521CBD|nr:DJ-1/PfpI family protein [Pelagibacterium xiamenense]MCD7061315.1 DJ-1/PfpI family protein [Pelagibacterium xiamenense]
MTRLAILLTEGFADWECAHLMASGRTYFGIEIVVATPGGAPVVSSGGLRVTPDADADAVGPEGCDGIVICGGTIWQSDAAPEISGLVDRFRKAGKLVAGICDGVLALARTGALDETPHTGNDVEQLKAAPGYKGAAEYVDRSRAVRAEGLVTASGLAPVTFMVEVFNELGYGGDELDAYSGMLAAEHQAACDVGAGHYR